VGFVIVIYPFNSFTGIGSQALGTLDLDGGDTGHQAGFPILIRLDLQLTG
jgi:hypothetical protein